MTGDDHEGSPSGREPSRCQVCGEPTEAAGRTVEEDVLVCSRGCQAVWNALGPIDSEPVSIDEPLSTATGQSDTRGDQEPGKSEPEEDPRAEQQAAGTVADGETVDDDRNGTSGEEETDETEDGAESEPRIRRTYLRIDGMHSATDEAYLESVADDLPGVVEAEASHVTESIRVDHDETRATPLEVRDELTQMGFTAYLREDSSATPDAMAGPSRRSREMSGLRKRRSDDMLEVRYILGVVFGSFLLVPYVTILYPAYLAMLFPEGPLQSFGELFTDSGVLFLRLYFVMTGIVLYITGKPLLRGAYISLKMRRPSIDLLASIAIVSAFGYSTVTVMVAGTDVYFDLVIAIAALVMGAILYESWVKERGLEKLTELTISQVDTARRYDDGTTTEVDVEDLEPGETVLVRAGERVPIDGTLAEGSCTVDEAIMTGESIPIRKTTGDDLIGGSIVTSGAAVVDVGEEPASSLERLTETVWNLQSSTHGDHRHTDALASRTLPLLAGVSVLAALGGTMLGGGPTAGLLAFFATWFVAAPWMIGLSTPLTTASNIEAALERGIVIFDETVFARIRSIDTVVFDKTGTLTEGTMTVLEADAPEDVLEAVAAIEARAAHPVGDAIATAFGPEASSPAAKDVRFDGGVADDTPIESPAATEGTSVSAFESYDNGVGGTVGGDTYLIGHPDLFVTEGWSIDDDLLERLEEARGFGRLPVAVGRNGSAVGLIVVGDDVREGWEETLTELASRDLGVMVVTGDDASATERFLEHPAVSQAIPNVSPAGKVAAIRHLERDRNVAMVGDGTNDAPALAEATLGVSLGGGTDLASDAADLALAEDDLESLLTTFDVAAAATERVEQNDRLALLYNAIVIPIAIVGLLNPVFTIAAVTIGALAIAFNAFRPLL